MALLLQGDHTDQLKGLGVAGVRGQEALVDGFSPGEITLPMGLDGVVERFRHSCSPSLSSIGLPVAGCLSSAAMAAPEKP